MLPVDAGEVGFLAETVRQYSVRLSPAGAGTDPDLPEPARRDRASRDRDDAPSPIPG